MGFACHDQLYGPLLIGKDAEEAIFIIKENIRPFIGGETAGKTESEGIGILKMFLIFLDS